MQLKTMSMHSLLFGISALFLINGCGKETTEYRMTVELSYLNQTDSIIRFELHENITSNITSEIELKPGSMSSIFSYEYDGVSKIVEPHTCCESFLVNVYAGGDREGLSKQIEVGEFHCVTHLNEKSVLLSNYMSEVIGHRHFRYTYTFTRDDFENAVLCK
jgi:hypothetical protein